MCPLLTTVATFFKFRTKAFLHMNYFYWHLDYDAQKPTFEKCPPNNGAICLEHEHESFSVCSDRILGSESASSDSKLWELLSYIYESLNCDFLFFRNLSPPSKGLCASQLFTNSVTQVLMNLLSRCLSVICVMNINDSQFGTLSLTQTFCMKAMWVIWYGNIITTHRFPVCKKALSRFGKEGHSDPHPKDSSPLLGKYFCGVPALNAWWSILRTL